MSHPALSLATAGLVAGLAFTHAGIHAPAASHPLYTLRLNVASESGKPPTNVDLEVVNTDNAALVQAQVPVVHGIGTVEVPAGHYGAFAFFIDGPAKEPTAGRLVVVQDFTVHPTSHVTTVAVDERSADEKVSVRVPRPATEDLLSLELYRLAAAGNYAFADVSDFPGIPLYVSPAPAATTGQLHYVVQWGAMGPGAHPAYRYDVAFAADKIPADETYKVLPSQLAIVHQHFSTDPAAVRFGNGQLFNGPVDQVTARGVPTISGINETWMLTGQNGEVMPGDLTDYLGTADGGRWAEQANTELGTILSADVHTFLAGRTYSVTWEHGPLAPGFGQHQGPQPCGVCIAGHTLSLGFNPQGDSEPDHTTWEGRLFQPIALSAGYKFAIYRGGAPIARSAKQPGLVVPGVPDAPATFRAVLGVDLSDSFATQSTSTQTDLTVPFEAADTAPLPASDSCAGETARIRCRILPALTLGYQLATNELNTSHAAVQTMGLRVSHVSFNGAGSHAAITHVAVWVSFDRGATWQSAKVRGSAGSYAVSWANPPSARGTDPSIRVTATDALGGSITQTITNAYTLAP